jgi:hypothetical protein
MAQKVTFSHLVLDPSAVPSSFLVAVVGAQPHHNDRNISRLCRCDCVLDVAPVVQAEVEAVAGCPRDVEPGGFGRHEGAVLKHEVVLAFVVGQHLESEVGLRPNESNALAAAEGQQRSGSGGGTSCSEKTASILSFPYVCPEPILANVRFV